MLRELRIKLEMFGRIRNFGIANRTAFPEESSGGKKFTELAAIVTSLEDQLVRREQARADGRKVKGATKAAALEHMKAIVATGRRASNGESEPHAFRMPVRRSATMILTAARLFMTEAAERKEKFLELGMPPTFLEDFGRAIEALAAAVTVQHDSRGARRLAASSIEAALARGMALVADLDVTVPNALRGDPARRSQYLAARRMDLHGPPEAPGPEVKPPTGTATAPASADPVAEPSPTASSAQPDVMIAS